MLGYIDENEVPLIKARVAREMASSDIFITEILCENLLNDLDAACLASLLSVLILF